MSKLRRYTSVRRMIGGTVLLILTAGFVISCRNDANTRWAQAHPQMESATAPASMPTTDAAAAPSADAAAPAGDQPAVLPAAYAQPLPGFSYPPAAPSAFRTDDQVTKMNAACIACHDTDAHTDPRSMHSQEVKASCVDCHGGNWQVSGAEQVANLSESDPRFVSIKLAAHVKPKHPELWHGSANPKASNASTLQESADYIRFVNPGDLRAANAACGACHNTKADDYVVDHIHKSMMATGPMLWEAALYNNGGLNRKIPLFGESYGVDGSDQAIFPAKRPSGEGSDQPDLNEKKQRYTPTATQIINQGLLSAIFPLPRWEITQPGNILRVFERGAKSRPIIGIPDPKDDAGRPDVKLSLRGFGTDVRTDPVFLGLQKTRLLDPTLSVFGTNDHPGDYRGSGCTACHVVYANDRDAVHSAVWSKFGNRGQSFSSDRRVNPPPRGASATIPFHSIPFHSIPFHSIPFHSIPFHSIPFHSIPFHSIPFHSIPFHSQPITEPSTRPTASYWDADKTVKDGESGHPIRHVLVKDVPSQTCMVCHMHPGTNVVNSFLGYQWWDNETDGEFMYPKQQKNPTPEEEASINVSNPEGTAPKGLWSNLYPHDESQAGLRAGPDFLENVSRLNPLLKYTQFADFHGHGWVFRKVFRQDRVGNMLDADGNKVSPDDPEKFNKAVHLKDIHLQMGMHCVDCHFQQDTHGDGNLYGETRNAVMEQCIDCHGTAEAPAKIVQYLKDKGESDDDKKLPAEKANDLQLTMFSGNAATAGLDPVQDAEQIRARNRKVATAHFDKALDENGNLVQFSAVYSAAKKEAQARGQSDDDFAADAKAAGLVEKWVVVQASDPILHADKFVPGDLAGRLADPASTEPATDDQKIAADQKTVRAKRALYAHTIRRGFDASGNVLWGGTPASDQTDDAHKLAHPDSVMSCYACHSAWNTSCFGCHLPMKANQYKPMLHNEGQTTRNYTQYDFQTLRDDIYMLGIDSTVKDHKVVPVRSACAVLVSSQDANRQWIYQQQQTVSAEGLAGTAFSPYFPHTVRAAETKQCTDCHISKNNDNNAIMAQLLMQGTHAVNFIGRFAYVAEGEEGLQAVSVTEVDEPQAVIGSKLHQLAYPDNYRKHLAGGAQLTEAYEHTGTVYDLQLRGEYLYAACGENGFIAYDVANVANKGFSERISTAPVSPLGQRFYVNSKFATSICSPSTLAIDPTRSQLAQNQEGLITEPGSQKPIAQAKIAPLYAFLYLTDSVEGLIVIGNPKTGVATLLDGDPTNNFLERGATFNPGGVLNGAKHMVLRGHYAYIAASNGISVVDLADPLHPKLITTISSGIREPRKLAVQFRYLWVCDADGLKVLDVTMPESPKLIESATVPMQNANDIYVSRTWGYIAAGPAGLAMLDLTNPEHPGPVTYFNPGNALGDARSVRIGMTNASLYAYVAAGVKGLAVLQLTAADSSTPGFLGFSPTPAPRIIAHYKTAGPALAISQGLDRDRAVDEDGNQLSVFGRRGARPFTLEEMQRLYLTGNGRQQAVFRVQDDPPSDPLPAATQPSARAD